MHVYFFKHRDHGARMKMTDSARLPLIQKKECRRISDVGMTPHLLEVTIQMGID